MHTLHSIFKMAVLTSALFAVPLFGNAPNYTYLALGDSISFGYNPTVPPTPATNFTGYPEIVAVDLNLPLGEVNASCPGQTSGSFLTGAPDNGCENNGDVPGFKAAYGLHAAYTGTQINFALSQFQTNPNINLVTLSIGGNDLLLLQQACATAPDFTACVGGALPGVLSTYAGNLTQILAAIRGEAGYTGNLVLSEYAAPNTDPTYIQAVAALNQVMVEVGSNFGARFADGFTAFQLASAPYGGDPCQAGLLVRLTATTCDVHPTLAGQSLLAATVIQALNFPSLTTGSSCNGIYSGTFKGNLTVTAGQNCLLVAGGVTGNITLRGGALTLSNVTITGDVQVQNGGVVSIGPGTVIGGNLQIQNVPAAGMSASQVCGSAVKGNVQVQNNGIPVAIGSNSPVCAGNAISGNLQTQNNAGATVILNNTVNGNLQDQNNTGQTQVFNNSVVNSLQCENNSLINGGGNTARQKQGQCASF